MPARLAGCWLEEKGLDQRRMQRPLMRTNCPRQLAGCHLTEAPSQRMALEQMPSDQSPHQRRASVLDEGAALTP